MIDLNVIKNLMKNCNINYLETPLIIPPVLPNELKNSPCILDNFFAKQSLSEEEKHQIKQSLTALVIQKVNLETTNCPYRARVTELVYDLIWALLTLVAFDHLTHRITHVELFLLEPLQKNLSLQEYALVLTEPRDKDKSIIRLT